MNAGTRERGAALLLAMLILTLVATLAAGMVWQQWRAVQVEAVERARTQAFWILSGALDWARLIVREDRPAIDHLGEVWAQPLAETKLSTFLAADKDNPSSADGIDAFLSGRILDAQSRYNLTNLLRDADPALASAEFLVFAKLCDAIGLPSDVAQRIAIPMRKAAAAAGEIEDDGGDGQGQAKPQPSDPLDKPLLLPQRMADLAWYAIEPEVIEKMRPFIDILPEATPVNLNTARAEVIYAVIDRLDLASAQRLTQARTRNPFEKLEDAKTLLPATTQLDNKRVSIASGYFEVQSRLRLEEATMEEHSIIHRNGNVVTLVRRERVRPEPGA